MRNAGELDASMAGQGDCDRFPAISVTDLWSWDLANRSLTRGLDAYFSPSIANLLPSISLELTDSESAPQSHEGDAKRPADGLAFSNQGDSHQEGDLKLVVPKGERRAQMFIELLKQFDSLDKNRDGKVAEAEIDKAINDRAMAQDKSMAESLAVLKLFVRSFASNGESLAVRKEDLQNLANLRDFLNESSTDRAVIRELLAKYREGKSSDQQLEVVAEFARQYIKKFGGTTQSFHDDLDKLLDSMDRLSELELRFDRIDKRSSAFDLFGSKLWGNGNDPSKAVKPEGVCQGLVGNCYFMAAIASQAQIDNEAVAKMIVENKDGSYTVTFPGKKPITVGAPTRAELILYSGVTENGIWPAVLEKAFGQYCMDNAEFRKEKKRGRTLQEATEGGGSVEGIVMLTGRDGVRIEREEQDKAWSAMMQSLKKGLPVIAGTGPSTESFLNGDKNSGLESRHAYAVLKIDETGVTLRNPYGSLADSGDGKSDSGKLTGTFKLTKEEFWKFFVEVEVCR